MDAFTKLLDELRARYQRIDYLKKLISNWLLRGIPSSGYYNIIMARSYATTLYQDLGRIQALDLLTYKFLEDKQKAFALTKESSVGLSDEDKKMSVEDAGSTFLYVHNALMALYEGISNDRLEAYTSAKDPIRWNDTKADELYIAANKALEIYNRFEN